MIPPTVAPAPTTAPAEEADSITIPKSVLGDRQCKPGEKLEMTVTDVDPETGDVEATMAGYGGEGGGEEAEMSKYAMETPDES